MAKWKVGEHEYELVFNMPSWIDLEKTVCTLDKIDEMLTGPERLTNALAIAVVLGSEGARQGLGDQPDRDWITSNWVPKNGMQLFGAINLAMSEGMRMETQKSESGGEVIDLALEEIEKKDGQDA